MTRRLFDSTSAVDIPAGSELVGGYVDGSSAWSAADWDRFPGRTIVRFCIFNDRYSAHVLDIEPGNNDARGAIPWIREKWLRGDTPIVYCFSDGGPKGYRITDVRDECDAVGLKHPLFIIAEWDNNPHTFDPAGDPGIVGKQYANSGLTGGHYDASVVADFLPGVDPMSFKDDPDAQAFVKDVRASLDAIKAVLAKDAHHTHIYAAKPETVVVGGRTSEPLEPPVPGAAYFSSDDSLSMIGWTYPDKTEHYFLNGVEVQK